MEEVRKCVGSRCCAMLGVRSVLYSYHGASKASVESFYLSDTNAPLPSHPSFTPGASGNAVVLHRFFINQNPYVRDDIRVPVDKRLTEIYDGDGKLPL